MKYRFSLTYRQTTALWRHTSSTFDIIQDKTRSQINLPSTMATTIADLLERNKATSAKHEPFATFHEMKEGGIPAPRTFIITCMDSRCGPEEFFDLQRGEVIVVRNAGGNARHALRDISIFDSMFGLDEIAIIHHTDCGTLHWTEDQIATAVKKQIDHPGWAQVDKMVPFGANKEYGLLESVKKEVAWIQGSPVIREGLKKGVRGFVFDIKTGKVEEVKPNFIT